jgi:hypothetical protein
MGIVDFIQPAVNMESRQYYDMVFGEVVTWRYGGLVAVTPGLEVELILFPR